MNTTGKNYKATSIGNIQARGRVTLHPADCGAGGVAGSGFLTAIG